MSRIWSSLYSKNGLAAKFIAKELLQTETGERIPRVSDISEKLSIGRGTAQGALRVLEELHAISLESRGHLGTFLTKKDADLLYEIAGVGPMIGVMPLPYSRKYEGLATGIVESLWELNKKSGLAYMRGSRRRLEALKSRRYDFTILSLMAAEEALKDHDGLEIIHQFGSESYVTAHRIFFSDSKHTKLAAGMKIGIDSSSSDQAEITLAECEGLDVELVEVNYMQLVPMLKNGQLDAAVWNADEASSVNVFPSTGFQTEKAARLAAKATNAVMVIEAERQDIKDQLGFLDIERICGVQRQVEEGEKYPHY